MIRVLFVCLGNICRSPMAEAVFAQAVREAGLEQVIEADSAGTGDWHIGAPPHAGTQAVLRKNDIAYNGVCRLITAEDLNAFDYIVTMDESNRHNVERIGQGRAKVVPLLDFAPEVGVREVPDPYFTGGFDEVFDMVRAGATGLLSAICEAHDLNGLS